MRTTTFFTTSLLLAGCLLGSCHSGRQIVSTLDKVADWQIQHFTYSDKPNPYTQHDYGIDAWTNGTFFLGLLEWSIVSPDSVKQRAWLKQIGEQTQWTIPNNFKTIPSLSIYHADELCVGQFYMGMYALYHQPAMMESTRSRLDSIMTYPGKQGMSYRNKQVWSWCDALFMAPALYAQMAEATGKQSYLNYMYEQWHNTYSHLFSRTDSLFFRDDSYFDKKEANGKKVFWGRGNGWVAAGTANLLKHLPKDYKERPFFEQVFVELCTKLAHLQCADGFWHASLLDTVAYPTPETSASALITYALAYGVNNGLLDRKLFLPVIDKAWNALVSAIEPDGKVCWVQPIGADPKAVKKEMTSVYGPGAMLLLGTEMLKLK